MYNDEFHDQGGSYTLDPATGKRARVEEPTLPSDTGRVDEPQALSTTATDATVDNAIAHPPYKKPTPKE